MFQKYCVVFQKHCVVFPKHCFVFQELFVAFADVGHRSPFFDLRFYSILSNLLRRRALYKHLLDSPDFMALFKEFLRHIWEELLETK